MPILKLTPSPPLPPPTYTSNSAAHSLIASRVGMLTSAEPVCSKSAAVRVSMPFTMRAVPGGRENVRTYSLLAVAKSRLSVDPAPAATPVGDTHSSLLSSMKLATTLPVAKRHSVSTRAICMKPDPCTVMTVPPEDGPETTLRLSTVALWYVYSMPLEL